MGLLCSKSRLERRRGSTTIKKLIPFHIVVCHGLRGGGKPSLKPVLFFPGATVSGLNSTLRRLTPKKSSSLIYVLCGHIMTIPVFFVPDDGVSCRFELAPSGLGLYTVRARI